MFIKKVGVADAIIPALAPVQNSILASFVLGSSAKGEFRPENDIDVLVIGDVMLRQLTALLRDADIAKRAILW